MDEEEQENNQQKMRKAIAEDEATPVDPREPRDPNDPGNGPSASAPVTSAPRSYLSGVGGRGILSGALVDAIRGYLDQNPDFLAGPENDQGGLLGPGFSGPPSPFGINRVRV